MYPRPKMARACPSRRIFILLRNLLTLMVAKSFILTNNPHKAQITEKSLDFNKEQRCLLREAYGEGRTMQADFGEAVTLPQRRTSARIVLAELGLRSRSEAGSHGSKGAHLQEDDANSDTRDGSACSDQRSEHGSEQERFAHVAKYEKDSYEPTRVEPRMRPTRLERKQKLCT